MTEHKGLPVAGYAPTQSEEAVALANEGKILEERVRRWFDKIGTLTPAPHTVPPKDHKFNPRLLAIARTHLELAMMTAIKSIFQPGENRIELPEDKA